MTVWKVTCFWEDENGYDFYDKLPTEIGIYSNLPLASFAAIHFVEYLMKRGQRYRAGYTRTISSIYSYTDNTWRGSIEISEHDDDYSYDYGRIEISKITLNKSIV